jgi:hypothetical protein
MARRDVEGVQEITCVSPSHLDVPFIILEIEQVMGPHELEGQLVKAQGDLQILRGIKERFESKCLFAK